MHHHSAHHAQLIRHLLQENTTGQPTSFANKNGGKYYPVSRTQKKNGILFIVPPLIFSNHRGVVNIPDFKSAGKGIRSTGSSSNWGEIPSQMILSIF